MPRHHRPLLALSLVLPLTFAACGDDSSPSPTGGTTNNGSSNNGVTNNGATNNGATNNGATNNGGEDVGVTNNGEPDAEDVSTNNGEPDADDAGDSDLPDTPDDADDTSPDVPPADCASFALVAERIPSLPLRTVSVSAQGGSGGYVWGFAPEGNRSGGDLDTRTGRYLTGTTGGVIDEITVSDTACDTTLIARVDVVRPATLYPERLQLPPGRELCFVVRGGSGRQGSPDDPWVWTMAFRGSGDAATLGSDGCYVAGDEAGVDIIQVEDTGTGQLLQAAAEVRTDAVDIRFSVPSLMLPPGETFPIAAEGATGIYTFSLEDADATGSFTSPDPDNPTGGVIFRAGPNPGTVRLVARDSFFGDIEGGLMVTVMAPAHHEPVPWGTHTDELDLTGIGDVNGDGYADAALALRGFGANGFNAGAVLVYLGGPNGLAPEPEQVISGDRRNHFLGRSIAGGDFNHDGCGDLAVGVYGENLTGTEIGEVRIYTGCNTEEVDDTAGRDWNGRLADNFPASRWTPALKLWRRVPGLDNRDRFGWGIVGGDFNGDGLDDLASSAYQAEAPNRIDLNDGEPYNSLGRVFLYYQKPNGIGELPDQVLDGLFVGEDGQLTSIDGFNLGGHLAVGRVNADDCDDLLVGSWNSDTNIGVVSLYMSTPTGNGCELPAEPALTIHPSDADGTRQGRLGWRVALEDLDGDCVDDLLMSHPLNAGNNGAVYAFLGDPTWSHTQATRRTRDQADATWTADGGDSYGFGLHTGDIDGDGIADMVVGGRTAEHDGTVADVGEVRLYLGLHRSDQCAGRQSPDEPLLADPIILPNRSSGNLDLFGQLVSVVGDVDGDAIDDLAIYAERGPATDLDDTVDHQGRLYWHPGAPESWSFDSLRALEIPHVTYDDRLGWAIERAGDVNDDGYDDFVFAAPWWDLDVPAAGYTRVEGSAGGVFLHLGGPEGLRPVPDAVFAGHAPHSASDLLGYALSEAGDFDGDGIDDVAIAAPFEDNGSWCTSCRNGAPSLSDNGALYVYRGRADLAPRRAANGALTRLSEPDFVICGPQVNIARVGRELAGGFDVNGDGFDDLVMSNWDWNTQRGLVYYALGRPPEGARTTICMDEGQKLGEGDANGDFMGYGVGGADLDGDGCAEMMASGYQEDLPGRANAGAIHVWRGFGAGCAAATPIHVTFSGNVANDNIGYRLTTPGDVDGDRIPDVVVGSSGYGTTNVGAVLVYSGAAMGNRLRSATNDTDQPLNATHLIAQILTPDRSANTNFGYGLRGAGDLNGDGFADLIIGERLSSLTGTLRAGAAWVYLGGTDQVALERPDLVIGGLAAFPDSEFGNSVTAGRVGGRAVILVGADLAEWRGPRFGEMGEVFLGITNLP